MKIFKKKRRYPIIPISAMSDIGFLLLIFIMLVSLINYRKEVKIEYPEAKKLSVTQAEKNFEIWIKENGDIFYDGKMVDLKKLETLIYNAIAKDPKVRIHILADKNTKYKHIDGVLNVLKILQHRIVSLVAKEEK